MAKRTNRKLKLHQIGVSREAMQTLLLAGGEILAVQVVRQAQQAWVTHDRPAGMLNALDVEVPGGRRVVFMFPLGGVVEMAVVTPEEAERQRAAIASGTPDTVPLHRVGIA